MTTNALERIYDFGVSKGVEFFFSTPCAEDNIKIIENQIGFSIPESYHCFLRKFGTLSFGGIEILGVPANKIDSKGVPNALWLTLKMRDEEKLPENLLIIEFLDDGFYACIKLTDLREDDAPIVLWYIGQSDVSSEKLEIISDSFKDYLQKRIEETIYLF